MIEDGWKSIKQNPAPLGDGARGKKVSGGCRAGVESSNLTGGGHEGSGPRPTMRLRLAGEAGGRVEGEGKIRVLAHLRGH